MPTIIDASGAYQRGVQSGLQTSPFAALLQGGIQGFNTQRDRQQRQQGQDLRQQKFELEQDLIQQSQEQEEQDVQRFSGKLGAINQSIFDIGGMNDKELRAAQIDMEGLDSQELEEMVASGAGRLAEQIQRDTHIEQAEGLIKDMEPGDKNLPYAKMIVAMSKNDPSSDTAKMVREIAQMFKPGKTSAKQAPSTNRMGQIANQAGGFEQMISDGAGTLQALRPELMPKKAGEKLTKERMLEIKEALRNMQGGEVIDEILFGILKEIGYPPE